MNIKNIIKYIGIAAYLWLGTSCVSEDFNQSCDNDQTIQENAEYYLSLNINIPTISTTRSTTTSSGDSEHGTLTAFDGENGVSSISLYFFDNSDSGDTKGKLLCSFNTTRTPDPLSVGTVTSSNDVVSCTLKQRVSCDDLRAIFGKKLRIYAIANNSSAPVGVTVSNATNDTPATTETSFLESVFSINGIKTGFVRSFATGFNSDCPMSNHDYYNLDLSSFSSTINSSTSDEDVLLAVRSLFSGFDGDNGLVWDITTYNGGKALELERSIARIDYKDGSELGNGIFKLNDVGMKLTGSTTTEDVYLKIQSLQLFNFNTTSYMFRHTANGINSAADYDEEDGFSISPFGIEKGNVENKYTWIADPKWDLKYTTDSPEDNAMAFSSNPLGYLGYPTETSGNWSLEKNDSYIKLETLSDWLNASGNATAKTITGDYAPWYYITENTVPTTEKMTIPFCTGIVFKAQVCKKSGNNYVAVTEAEATDITNKTIRLTDSNGRYCEPTFTVAQTDGDPAGYYLTYKFLIPHNFTSGSSVDGASGVGSSLNAMQIGVVRNNVYQLSLKGIEKLPSPEEPDNLYLSIDIKVLAWAKRDIHVTF